MAARSQRLGAHWPTDVLARAPTFPVTEANIATFRHAIDEDPNNGNLAAIDELFARDFVEHQERF